MDCCTGKSSLSRYLCKNLPPTIIGLHIFIAFALCSLQANLTIHLILTAKECLKLSLQYLLQMII
jgi:hypothetical protein